MWRRSSEESNTSSIEFKISTFNDLFPRQRRSAAPTLLSSMNSGDENQYVGKKKCPPWKEVEEGLTNGKYTIRRMNLDHDLYDRVEKIYEEDQPQFYHCIRCNALLRYNSGGSYRRHFAICKVEDDDEMVTERVELFNENEDEINGDKPNGVSNESNGQIRLTRSRTAEKKTDRELMAASEVNRTKLLRLLIEWSVTDLVPFRVFRSTAFRRVMDEHAEMIELRCGVKQSTSSNLSDLIELDENLTFAQEVEKHCCEINQTSRLDVVREINRNGCALTVELCRVDEVEFTLLTAYFFCKSEDRWDLMSTVVDYTKWNQSKKTDQRSSSILLFGVNEVNRYN
ncbi:hypothetical protein M3Y94_01293800 [Aphelenchoides besseyi]|nr:hypothetical protein M3Y94_01293800 [Aphelenchoides besseyi]